MRKTGRKNFYRNMAIIMGAVFLISLVLLTISLWEREKQPVFDTGSYALEYKGENYVRKEGLETFLVMGLDKYEGENFDRDAFYNNKQADFLMLFVFDNLRGTCSAIHINRDTMAEVNILGVAGNSIGTEVKQIALAHTYGNGMEVSCRNVSDAVSDLLMGTSIDHYISVTMDAVPLFNDMVGGVEVEVLEDLTGADPALRKGRTVTLKGEQALKYVRTRYGLEDSTNMTRMLRQRQYLTALYEKTVSRMENDSEFGAKLSVELANYIVSDRSANRLTELTKKFSEYEFAGIIDLPGESVTGREFMEFYPDVEKLEEMTVETFYKKAEK